MLQILYQYAVSIIMRRGRLIPSASGGAPSFEPSGFPWRRGLAGAGFALTLAFGLAGTSQAQQDLDTFNFAFAAAPGGESITGRFTAEAAGDPDGTRQDYILRELLSASVNGESYADAGIPANYQPRIFSDLFTWDTASNSVSSTEHSNGVVEFIGDFGSNYLLSLKVSRQGRAANLFTGTRSGNSFQFASAFSSDPTTTLRLVSPPTPPPPPSRPRPPSPPDDGDMTPEPPMFESAAVDGDTLTLTYSEDLDEDSVPDAEDFAVTVDGEAIDVFEVSVSGTDVTLTLESEVEAGDEVTVSYTPGEDPIREAEEDGLPAEAISGEEATNDTEPPMMPEDADGGSGGGCALASAGESGVDIATLFLLATLPFASRRVFRTASIRYSFRTRVSILSRP